MKYQEVRLPFFSMLICIKIDQEKKTATFSEVVDDTTPLDPLEAVAEAAEILDYRVGPVQEVPLP